jgi:hypothetical protein
MIRTSRPWLLAASFFVLAPGLCHAQWHIDHPAGTYTTPQNGIACDGTGPGSTTNDYFQFKYNPSNNTYELYGHTRIDQEHDFDIIETNSSSAWNSIAYPSDTDGNYPVADYKTRIGDIAASDRGFNVANP